MAYVIAEPCIDVLDVSCVSVCPVDCIHFDEGTDRKLFIDPNECIDCGACEPECPVNAIFPEESLPTEWANYTAIVQRLASALANDPGAEKFQVMEYYNPESGTGSPAESGYDGGCSVTTCGSTARAAARRLA